jgi:hypothetical protein
MTETRGAERPRAAVTAPVQGRAEALRVARAQEPAEPGPAELQPAELQPAELQPAEPQPAERAEPQPVGSQAAARVGVAEARPLGTPVRAREAAVRLLAAAPAWRGMVGAAAIRARRAPKRRRRTHRRAARLALPACTKIARAMDERLRIARPVAGMSKTARALLRHAKPTAATRATSAWSPREAQCSSVAFRTLAGRGPSTASALAASAAPLAGPCPRGSSSRVRRDVSERDLFLCLSRLGRSFVSFQVSSITDEPQVPQFSGRSW